MRLDGDVKRMAFYVGKFVCMIVDSGAAASNMVFVVADDLRVGAGWHDTPLLMPAIVIRILDEGGV
ncbi:MAG: hypothetical protein AAGD22_09265 [Verrucomicrobiota bacterium]